MYLVHSYTTSNTKFYFGMSLRVISLLPFPPLSPFLNLAIPSLFPCSTLSHDSLYRNDKRREREEREREREGEGRGYGIPPPLLSLLYSTYGMNIE